MIIQPNRRRRNRLFSATAAILALLFVVTLLASGWTLPAISFSAGSTATPVAATAVSSPGLATPTPTLAPPTSTPSPTQRPVVDGCVVAPEGVLPATVLYHGVRSGKQVALTFDDGTNPDVVMRIYRILRDERVNATFFPTGRSVERFPDTWKRLAAESFPIGNHTYNHQSLAKRCYEDQLAELTRDERVIEGFGLTVQPYMRPPYEEFDAATRLATSGAGMSHIILWDVDTLDWTGIGARKIRNLAVNGVSGSIVLMHTSTSRTAAALPRIIKRYKARGFTFVTIGQLLGIPGPVPFP